MTPCCPYCDIELGEGALYVLDNLERPTCQSCACPYCDWGHYRVLDASACRDAYDMDIGFSHERLIA